MARWTIYLLAVLVSPTFARADFYFLLPSSEQGGSLKLVWNDRAQINADNQVPADILLKHGQGSLPVRSGGPGWLAVTPSGPNTSATIEHGVLLRGQLEPAFLLFYPKHQSELLDVVASPATSLELTAIRRGNGLAFQARFQGQPLPNHEIIVQAPGQKRGKPVRTDSLGYTTSFDAAGLYSARMYHKERRTGEYQGRSYAEVRHYATLTAEFKP